VACAACRVNRRRRRPSLPRALCFRGPQAESCPGGLTTSPFTCQSSVPTAATTIVGFAGWR
jgi:hypothetical protein